MTAFSMRAWLSRRSGKVGHDSARQLLEEGDAAFVRNDVNAAELRYREAISATPAFARAHLGLGAALHAQGRYDDAIGALNTALELDSKLANAHELLATNYLSKSEPSKAEPHLRQAISLDVAGSSNYLVLAQILATQRRYQDALDVAMQGIATNPDFVELEFFAGNLQFEMGQLLQASELFRAVLRREPSHFMASYNLGLVLLKRNELEAARDALRHVVDLKPQWPEPRINLGCVLYQMGNLDDAQASFEQALVQRPDLAQVYFNLGEIAMARGGIDKAAIQYRTALEIDPQLADASRCLGIALVRLGAREEALIQFQRAIDIAPGDIGALMQLAELRFARDEMDDALSHYREVLAHSPRHVDALLGAVSALQNLAEHSGAADRNILLDDALAFAEAAVGTDNANTQALQLLGVTLGMLGRPDEADEKFRKLLAIDPDSISAHHNLGVSMEARGRQAAAPENLRYLNEALEHYSTVTAAASHDLGALMGMAAIYSLLLRDAEAADAYERILKVDPDYAPAKMSFGILKLRMGEFASGWQYMEARWNLGEEWQRLKSYKPAWDGQAELDGKTIVLYNEQGFGDAIQFIRYTELLAQRGAKVLVRIDPALRLLCASSPGVYASFSGDDIPEHDYHCSISTLPKLFETTLENLPTTVPYLRANSERIEHWRKKIVEDGKFRVGLVWAGDPRLQDDMMRSIHVDRLRVLFDTPQTIFYTLQLGGAAQQLVSAPTVVDLTAEMSDFQETAALAEHLDLTICVDTAVVHLLGAIGKPVWLLNRNNSCWRWMLDRTDSPWYPTLRIFRQPQLGDWDSVIAEVKLALENEAARKRNT